MNEKKYITPSEKVFLTELINHYKDVIECKKTDAVNASEKKKAWVSISSEFNSVPDHTKRTPQQLQKAWENIKCRRKKELSRQKQDRMATGGGVMKTPPQDDAVDCILDTVDIEMKDIVDNDELMLKENYEVVDNLLVPVKSTEIMGDNTDNCRSTSHIIEGVTPKRHATSETGTNKSSKRRMEYRGSAIDQELEVRMKRIKNMEMRDEEFHALRMENEKHLHTLRVENEKQLHAVRLQTEKTKLEAEELALEFNKRKLN